jgi:hypothetical protein
MADTVAFDAVEATRRAIAKVLADSVTTDDGRSALEAFREMGSDIVPINEFITLTPEQVAIAALNDRTISLEAAMEAAGYSQAAATSGWGSKDPEDADDGFADVAKALPPALDRERLAWAASKHDLVLWSSPLRCLCGWRDSQALAVGSWAIETAAIETARARWREHLIAGIADAYENRVTFYATPGPSYEQPQPPLGQVADAVAEVEKQITGVVDTTSPGFVVVSLDEKREEPIPLGSRASFTFTPPVPIECPTCGVARTEAYLSDKSDATWLTTIGRCAIERSGENLVPRG